MSTSVRVRQNTSAASGVSMSRMRPSAAGLCARSTTYARWVINAGRSALVVPPTVMRTGSSRKRLAMPAMRGGIVAENNTVWRSLGSEPRIVSMSSAKPMSSISSASSSTTVRIPSTSSERRPRWSRTRPGVPTTTWTPRSSDCSCRKIGCPPYTGTTLTPSLRPYLKIASETCIASSRVGTRTRAVAVGRPRPIVSECSNGRANAAVLPVPVAACPTRSRPSTRCGIVSRWTGVGSS